MSWSIGYDNHWKRDIGYGVPAYCDHPRCRRVIDRGLSFVCGGQAYGGAKGCGLYFCGKHHGGDHYLCRQCEAGAQAFTPKPEHPKWVKFKLKDPSWAEWTRKYPEEVKALLHRG